MADRDRSSDDAFWQARTALRLQRRVLPEASVQLLADEVVRRLANQHLEDTVAGLGPGIPTVEQFHAALVSSDSDAAFRLIRQERHDGTPLEAVYLGTLAAASRHLGVLWDEDRISFLQLTVAAGRIFEIMRWLRRQIPQPSGVDVLTKHALFATVPGEMHSIAITISADLFRNRGWEIELLTGLDHEALIEAIAGRGYRIIGLSASNAGMVVPLTRMIVALRITHPEAKILVSGRIVEEVPGLNALIRADAVLADGDNAVAMCERLARDG
ncbi:MAG: cobalamin B12-binding domain-containing protein [Rubellimicrobium sp.]|nr:cobalamin B12-binding domain-containing protein [Rubellimicrobium sp.]